MSLRLTREDRARLFAGDYSPLAFEKKPKCKPGDRYVLSWSRPRPFRDERGVLHRPRREAVLWIEVTKLTRRAKGGWAVRFDVHDHRHPRRLLRSVPPRYGDELRRVDAVVGLTAEEIEQASEESSYTSDPGVAVDELDAVPKDWKDPGAAARTQQQQALEKARRDSLSLGAQLDSYLTDARESRVDVHDRVRRIKREIELLARDLDGRAA